MAGSPSAVQVSSFLTGELNAIDVQTKDHILEIGFGTGRLLAQMAASARQGKVSGVDYSDAMLQEAQRLNRQWIEQGRMDLKLGDLSRLNYPDAHFTTVCTANTVYYWPDPVQIRVLRMAPLAPSEPWR